MSGICARLIVTGLVAASLGLLLASCGQQSSAPVANSPAPVSHAMSEWAAEIASYRNFVIDQVDALLKSTKDFTTEINEGDIAEAKAVYPVAREYYERIEPIAEAFGDLDPHIDARAKDVVAPDGWRGFHRIEKALWLDQNISDQAPVAAQLLADVKLLRAKVETVDITIEQMVIGATELLNEVSSSKITGEEELYSHTDFYDFVANVEGAQKIFTVLQPKIQAIDANLVQTISDRFASLLGAIGAYKQAGGYVSYNALSSDQTRKLSQAVDALAEPLSNLGKIVKGSSQ
jgi:iron uptake system component EfeO